jgi:hypothetical protein
MKNPISPTLKKGINFLLSWKKYAPIRLPEKINSNTLISPNLTISYNGSI